MKKLMSVILTLCALCALTPAFAETAAPDTALLDETLFGTWVLENAAELFGEELAADLTETMTFSPDGTVTVTASYKGFINTDSWTWQAVDGILTMNDGDAAYTVEDGVLTVEQDGLTMVLRLQEEEEVRELPPLDEALFGTWSVENLADIVGVLASSMTETMTFNPDGTVTVTATAMGRSNSMTYTWEAADGALTMNNGTALYTIEDDVLTMNQDGIIMVLRRVAE